MKHGKKYNQGAQLVDRAALYEPSEALDIAVKTATAKFDETVEVHIRLGVDSRHADQQVSHVARDRYLYLPGMCRTRYRRTVH